MAQSSTSPAHRRNIGRHPVLKTPDELTVGQRAADRLRNGMGSWWFVIGAIVFLVGWMVGNRGSGFDPYPFILLNLVLSCLAALQGAILLIAAKREDQISSELAQHDYEVNVNAEQRIERLETLIGELHGVVVRGEKIVGPADGV